MLNNSRVGEGEPIGYRTQETEQELKGSRRKKENWLESEIEGQNIKCKENKLLKRNKIKFKKGKA